MSALFEAMGVRCGHESVFGVDEALGGRPRWADYDGDSSWMGVVSVLEGNEIVLHQTRHPLEVVRSLVGIGLLRDGAVSPYADVIRSHAPEVFTPPDDAERAPTLWRVWNERIEGKAALRYRVEDAAEAMPLVCETLGIRIRPRRITLALDKVPSTTNNRQRDETIRWGQIEGIVGELAARYGYAAEPPTRFLAADAQRRRSSAYRR